MIKLDVEEQKYKGPYTGAQDFTGTSILSVKLRFKRSMGVSTKQKETDKYNTLCLLPIRLKEYILRLVFSLQVVNIYNRSSRSVKRQVNSKHNIQF